MRKVLLVLVLIFIFFLPGFVKAEKYYRLNGTVLSYEQIIEAPKTILFIWTTWCPVCREDIKYINDNPYLPEDVKIFFVNIGEKQTQVERLLNAMRLKDFVNKNVLLNPDGKLAEKFSIVGIPTCIFFKNKIPVYRSHFINKELITEVFGDK